MIKHRALKRRDSYGVEPENLQVLGKRNIRNDKFQFADIRGRENKRQRQGVLDDMENRDFKPLLKKHEGLISQKEYNKNVLDEFKDMTKPEKGRVFGYIKEQGKYGAKQSFVKLAHHHVNWSLDNAATSRSLNRLSDKLKPTYKNKISEGIAKITKAIPTTSIPTTSIPKATPKPTPKPTLPSTALTTTIPKGTQKAFLNTLNNAAQNYQKLTILRINSGLVTLKKSINYILIGQALLEKFFFYIQIGQLLYDTVVNIIDQSREDSFEQWETIARKKYSTSIDLVIGTKKNIFGQSTVDNYEPQQLLDAIFKLYKFQKPDDRSYVRYDDLWQLIKRNPRYVMAKQKVDNPSLTFIQQVPTNGYTGFALGSTPALIEVPRNIGIKNGTIKPTIVYLYDTQEKQAGGMLRYMIFRTMLNATEESSIIYFRFTRSFIPIQVDLGDASLYLSGPSTANVKIAEFGPSSGVQNQGDQGKNPVANGVTYEAWLQDPKNIISVAQYEAWKDKYSSIPYNIMQDAFVKNSTEDELTQLNTSYGSGKPTSLNQIRYDNQRTEMIASGIDEKDLKTFDDQYKKDGTVLSGTDILKLDGTEDVGTLIRFLNVYLTQDNEPLSVLKALEDYAKEQKLNYMDKAKEILLSVFNQYRIQKSLRPINQNGDPLNEEEQKQQETIIQNMETKSMETYVPYGNPSHTVQPSDSFFGAFYEKQNNQFEKQFQ